MILAGLTSKQWFRLPLPLRVKWWKETNYGTREPSPELLEEMRRAAGETTDEH